MATAVSTISSLLAILAATLTILTHLRHESPGTTTSVTVPDAQPVAIPSREPEAQLAPTQRADRPTATPAPSATPTPTESPAPTETTAPTETAAPSPAPALSASSGGSASSAETISGRIHALGGRSELWVDDARGFPHPDRVRLQPDTVFVPAGSSPAVGASVVIKGYNGGSVFVANEVDLTDNPTAAATDATPAAQQDGSDGRDELVGRIRQMSGPYDLEVTVAGGLLAHVHLHPGTVIVPTGLQLVPGMSVTVKGSESGAEFEADEIDTIYVRR